MSIKSRFIVWSIIVALISLTLCYFFLQRYSSHIPLLNRLSSSQEEDPEDPAVKYKGLVPEPDDPNGIYYQDRVLVLMYHDLSPTPDDIAQISVANFEKQIQLMSVNNFHWITMSQYRDFILHGKPVPANAVLLTFDDGYESLYEYAYPILRKYNAPASSFLIVNSVSNPKEKGVPKVTWEQVKLMHQNGMEFFSHTYDSHKYVPTESANRKLKSKLARRMYLKDQDRVETEEEYTLRVTNDLKKANEILQEKLGEQNHILAFPYGAFSKSLLAICKDLGIDITLSVKSGLNKTGQHNGYRLNAGGMTNDPVLQLSLMKHAQERIGNNHFKSEPTNPHFTLWTLVVLLIAGLFWLRSGWKLLEARKGNSKGSSST